MTIYDEIRAELDTVIAALEAAQKKLEAAERLAEAIRSATQSGIEGRPLSLRDLCAALAAYREAGG